MSEVVQQTVQEIKKMMKDFSPKQRYDNLENLHNSVQDVLKFISDGTEAQRKQAEEFLAITNEIFEEWLH